MYDLSYRKFNLWEFIMNTFTNQNHAQSQSHPSYPRYPTQEGYLTEKIRLQYIHKAMENKILPENAHRMPHVLSLTAPSDTSQAIQFWQLYSVLGQDRIGKIVTNFYQRVFADEEWFRSVFAKVGPISHHVNTQSAMWIDVMGGGLTYHGGEFWLNFHHTHNAMELMNDKGAKRWVKLMIETLNDPSLDMTDDPRVKSSLSTFLSHFMDKYAAEFEFKNDADFGKTNLPLKRKINFLKMSSDEIEALTEDELKEALLARKVDLTQYRDKNELINKALML